MRYHNPVPLHLLESILQHRPIYFAQDVQAHLDDQIRADTQDVPIEGSMVQLAESEAIGDDGLALGVTIGEDVGGFEQLGVPQPADGALGVIGVEHPLTEALLVEATLGEGGDVMPARLKIPWGPIGGTRVPS